MGSMVTPHFHDFKKHGKAWEIMGSMVQHSIMISDSMEKHGEHGTAFSHDIRQHGIAWGTWYSIFSRFQTAWESMGSLVTPNFHDFK